MQVRPPRAFRLIGSEDAWLRCAHSGTALVGGVVQLAWTDQTSLGAVGGDPGPAAGLAFDPQCRLYHSILAEGRVERILWAADPPAEALDLFASPVAESFGEFASAAPAKPALNDPRGLAVDANDRLFVGETGAGRVLVYDLWSRTLLGITPVPGKPLDLAVRRAAVVALLGSPSGLVEITARTGPSPLPLPPGVTDPARIAVNDAGDIFVLDRARTPGANVRATGYPEIAVPDATDIEFQPGGVLVAAGFPGDNFRAFSITGTNVSETSPLMARNYDGLGIVRAPDGRIAFWTPRGVRHAIPARAKYESQGRVTGFRLDCGEFHTTWGRIFLDACIPQDTTVRIYCAVEDEPPPGATVPLTPPANTVSATVIRPDLSPPMPPLELAPADSEILQRLHRRETGIEWPWAAQPGAPESFQTYEAPVIAGPGRYLWVTLLLAGNTRFTPRILSLRAEFPTHDYMQRLPKLYSRDEVAADFLRRYLAMFDDELGELEAKAVVRHPLVDPRSTPAAVLPWLASFVGLTLDERWPEACSRTMIREAIRLFRFRGTIRGLTRFLEIYLGVKPILLEDYRLRGLGGVLGTANSGVTSNSVLGAGFRIGGAVGDPGQEIIGGTTADDAFTTHAHRFTVVIPAMLTAEQTDVVNHILDVHRPAHTLVTICSVGAGMRVGRGLHLELTSIVGPTGGFRQLQLSGALVGRDAILGRPLPGTSLGGSRLGEDSRVG